MNNNTEDMFLIHVFFVKLMLRNNSLELEFLFKYKAYGCGSWNNVSLSGNNEYIKYEDQKKAKIKPVIDFLLTGF